ncbi:hypothetical protein EDD85DRAFT_832894 [Armillaria nabsnona]|nr:hypothetical protein EDD85DRAFT_832894 [Armillaria nabsnona]
MQQKGPLHLQGLIFLYFVLVSAQGALPRSTWTSSLFHFDSYLIEAIFPAAKNESSKSSALVSYTCSCVATSYHTQRKISISL